MKRNDAKKARIFAEEGFIADTQFAIHNLLEDKKMNRADLAKALDVSEARVSQMFSDEAKNLTLRTIARIFHVLGEEVRISSPRLDQIFYGGDAAFSAAQKEWKKEPNEMMGAVIRSVEAAACTIQLHFNETNDNDVISEEAIAA